MKRALTLPLPLAMGVALAGGCSDDPSPEANGNYATMGGVTTTVGTAGPTTAAATSTTGDLTTAGQAAASTTAGVGVTNTGVASTGPPSTTATSAAVTGATGSGGASSITTAGIGGGTTSGVGGVTSTAATGAGGTTSTTGNTTPPVGSSGCGVQASQETGEWVSQDGSRQWAIYLPDNYDPNRAYPLVVQLHGCTSGTNNVPVERESGEDAIHVRGTGSGANTCWDTNADVEFFDTIVDGVKTASCVDENRVFAAGYSSGSWLISVLACTRGDVLRAAGTVAGGNALGNADCAGTIAQIFIHDLDDTENRWQDGNGGHVTAMNRLIEENGCTPDNPVPEDPAPCVRYQGCGENPIKHCPTTGEGHNRQDDFAAAAFWEFFSEF
jgi:poly(3-hydroxybutyrate) depolymerase